MVNGEIFTPRNQHKVPAVEIHLKIFSGKEGNNTLHLITNDLAKIDPFSWKLGRGYE